MTGGNRMDVAKAQVIDQLKVIPVNDDYYLNVYKFGCTSVPVFPRPLSVNQAVKDRAISFVSALRAVEGCTVPFAGLAHGIQQEHVEQMIILTDGGARDYGICFHDSRPGKFADCVYRYNE